MSSYLKALLKCSDKDLLKKLRNLSYNEHELILTALLIFCGKALLKKLRNLSSNDQELTLEGLVKMLWQRSLEEAKEPELQ